MDAAPSRAVAGAPLTPPGQAQLPAYPHARLVHRTTSPAPRLVSERSRGGGVLGGGVAASLRGRFRRSLPPPPACRPAYPLAPPFRGAAGDSWRHRLPAAEGSCGGEGGGRLRWGSGGDAWVAAGGGGVMAWQGRGWRGGRMGPLAGGGRVARRASRGGGRGDPHCSAWAGGQAGGDGGGVAVSCASATSPPPPTTCCLTSSTNCGRW